MDNPSIQELVDTFLGKSDTLTAGDALSHALKLQDQEFDALCARLKKEGGDLDSLNGLTDDPMDQAKSHKLRMDDLDNRFNDDPHNHY